MLWPLADLADATQEKQVPTKSRILVDKLRR